MGVPRLKKKIELNYRRGTSAHYCSECNAYISEFDVRGIDGRHIGFEPRCMVMGPKSGRSYRINPNNICDAHYSSDHLNRINPNNNCGDAHYSRGHLKRLRGY